MIFRSTASIPTDEQAALIGHFLMDWAIVDALLAIAIARLVQAPEFPTRALTDQMQTLARIKALRPLLAMHEKRYHHCMVHADTIAVFRKALKLIPELKKKRDGLAHWATLRVSDQELHVQKLSGNVPPSDEHVVSLSLADLADLRARCGQLAEMLQAAIEAIPVQFEPPARLAKAAREATSNPTG